MPPNLPPYLTSGASSRAHHALLVKLHEADSSQEERQIISNEITRLKDVLGVPGQSTVSYDIRSTPLPPPTSLSLVVPKTSYGFLHLAAETYRAVSQNV